MRYLKLFETYTTINDLTTLTTELIKQLSSYITKNFDIENDIEFKLPFEFIETKFNTDIQKFIDSNFIKSIKISGNRKNIKAGGYYDDRNKTISLLLDYDIEFIKNMKSNDDATIYFYISGKFYETLLHELQHAFDDFRSNGKFKDKNYSSFDVNNHDNSKMEIDAYFTATVYKIKFYDMDYADTETSEIDNIMIEIKVMRDYDKVKNDFVSKYPRWNILTDENKKRILHKFGKYYIDVKTDVLKFNKEKHLKDWS